MSLVLRYAALSDVGRIRHDNQDSGYAGPHLLAVADGVGGAARGDIASTTAVEQLRRLDRPPGDDALEAVAGAIHRTHDRIAELVDEHPEIDGTSTTVTAAVFDGTQLAIGHVGDSRAYLLRDGRLSQLTTDHTFVQSLIDEGRITADEARVHPHRNLILRAVDGVHEPEPDVFVEQLAPGDRVLLCSDGCSGALDDDQLATLLGTGAVEEACVELVRGALEAGSSDNVTVVVAEVLDAEVLGAEGGAAEEGAPTGRLPTKPAVVGAASEATRRGFGLLRGRRSHDTGELEPVPGEELDPEALRYAPREPRRFVWLRRVGIGVLALAVLCGVGIAAYAWTQTQYFVGASGRHVAVFKGVQADVPGLRMHHVLETSTLRLTDLPDYNARQVRDGIGADSLADARGIIGRLRGEALCPPTPSPSPSPSPSPTGGPTKRPTGTVTGKPTGRATGRATGKAASTRSVGPSPNPSPTATTNQHCTERP